MDDHFPPGRVADDEDGRFSAVSREPRFHPEISFVSIDKENSDLFMTSGWARSEAGSGSVGETDDVGGEAESKEKIQSSKELPDYLDHLRGREWFDKRFPRSRLEVSPLPFRCSQCCFSLSGASIPPMPIMPFAYSLYFWNIYKFPPYFRKVYVFCLIYVFLLPPILTMMHLCIMHYMYWTPLLVALCITLTTL